MHTAVIPASIPLLNSERLGSADPLGNAELGGGANLLGNPMLLVDPEVDPEVDPHVDPHADQFELDPLWGSEHPSLTDVLVLESDLLASFYSSTRALQEPLFALDFTYITPRGVAYDREQTLQLIADHAAAALDQPIVSPSNVRPIVSPITGQLLGDDFVLLTYVADCGLGPISRSSLWRKSLRSWQIVFHQGTAHNV